MKKLIMLLLTLTLILGVFASCNKTASDDTSDTTGAETSGEETTAQTSAEMTAETTEDTSIYTSEETTTSESEETTAITDEETGYYSGWIPGHDMTFHYSSYNVLLNHLDTENSRIILEKEKWGVRFSKFIDALSERKSVPLFNGQIPPNNGGDQIIIFPDDRHALPWIWYRCDYNEQYMIIKITYPDAVLEKDFSRFESTSEVLKEISSKAPNVHNADEFKDAWKNIYEKDLIIEEKTVSALVCESNYSSDRSLLQFYYNGVYVIIQCDLEALTDEFWQGFSIE